MMAHRTMSWLLLFGLLSYFHTEDVTVRSSGETYSSMTPDPTSGFSEIHVCPIFTQFVYCLLYGNAISCYQCDSNEDYSCPSSERFDEEVNAPINCNSFEANVPGQFCMKITQESPGWRGWKKITRRCGSRTDSGVAWGCRWQWDTVGVFKEICYCESDRCNGSSAVKLNLFFAIMVVLSGIFAKKFLQ